MNQKFIYLIICLLLLTELSIQNYTTNSTRTQNVKNSCSKSRKQMFQGQNDYYYNYYGDLTKKEVSIDGDQMFKYIFDKKFGDAWDLVKGKGQLWTYSIFFAIGLVLLVFSAPFLICCCCCPDSCPPCYGCRQPKEKPYTKFQKRCPAICSIALATIVIGTMIALIIIGVNFLKAYDDTQCSLAVLFDDTLNGNVTLDQKSFFAGLTTLRTELTALQTQLTQLQNEVQPVRSSGATVQNINTKISNSQTELLNVPNGAGGNLVLAYNSPIVSTTPTTTINSLFPNVLGNTTTAASLVGAAYLGLQGVQASIAVIAQAADTFSNGVTAFQSAFNSVISEVDTNINQITKIDNNVNKQSERIQTQYVNRVSIAYFCVVGATLLFGVLYVLTTICTCVGCFFSRKLMYFLCGLLVFMGILTFLLAIAFSALTFATYYGCHFLSTGLSSTPKFEEYFGPILKDQQITNIIKVCVPTGTGNIVQQIVDADTYTLLTSLGTLTTNLQSFDATQLVNLFKQSYQSLSPTIEKYQRAQILDIPSDSDFNSLEKISNAQNYACSQTGFNQDSWIPSVNQDPSYVACKISNGALVTNTSCGNFNSRDTGCIGCFDTYGVFQSNVTSANVLAALTGRYASANCITFNTELSNIWNNFYRIKKEQIGPVLTRSNTATTNLNDIANDLSTSVAPTFKTVFDNLLAIDRSITDPKYGLIAGLNCKVIGQDITLIQEVACNNVFVNSFLMRIMFIMASFSILVISCLTVCIGVRNFRTQQQLFYAQDEVTPISQYDTQNKTTGCCGRRRRKYHMNGKTADSAQQLKNIA